MSIIKENLQTVHYLENDLKLDFKIFKSSVESTVSAEQSKSRSRSNSLNKNSDDTIEKSLSDRILRSTTISASSRSDGFSKFAVEISIFFLRETLNIVKRERERPRKERR